MFNELTIWQADFYKTSATDEGGQTLWQLLLCDRGCEFIYRATCSQPQATSAWLESQLQQAAAGILPDRLQVFRPQAVGLLSAAAEKLGLVVEPTRRTAALKRELQKQAIAGFDPLQLDRPPPQALPDRLWGEQWRFATLPAGDWVEAFRDRPIPIQDLPPSLFPVELGLASTTPIPGIIIYGGRRSMPLARWLQDAQPVSLSYMAAEVEQSGGLILEAGLVDRWILATFDDPEIEKAAQLYNQRKKASQGLHFLLIQPDDSDITHTGIWLLQDTESE